MAVSLRKISAPYSTCGVRVRLLDTVHKKCVFRGLCEAGTHVPVHDKACHDKGCVHSCGAHSVRCACNWLGFSTLKAWSLLCCRSGLLLCLGECDGAAAMVQRASGCCKYVCVVTT